MHSYAFLGAPPPSGRTYILKCPKLKYMQKYKELKSLIIHLISTARVRMFYGQIANGGRDAVPEE